MSSAQLQLKRPANDSDRQQQGRQGTRLTLPAMESSPYLKYSDLEQYKRNAYGTDQLGFHVHHHHHHPSKHNAAAAAASNSHYKNTSTRKEEEGVASLDRKSK